MEILMGYALLPYGFSLRKADLALESNILINDNGRACLAGFSLLMTIPDELTTPSSASSSDTTRWTGAVQWSAPEVLNDEAVHKETDIFSLAMVIIEVRVRRSTVDKSRLTCVSPGLHWSGSVWQYSTYHGHGGNNARQAPSTTETSGGHRKVVEFDQTVLEGRPSLAPGSSGSPASSPRFVSFLFILAIAHP